MNFQRRKSAILKALSDSGSLGVTDLASILEGVSTITIRRDLAVLADQGLIIRTHGGAMHPSLARNESVFVNKIATKNSQKEAIGALAAKLLVDRETAFLDCGSTVFCMAQFLRHKQVKIITNSLPILTELMGSDAALALIGGEVDQDRQAMHGSMAASQITRYRADKAFIGADGFSLANGLSARSETEAEITTSILKQAREVYLLCDSSKLEKDAYLPFAGFNEITALITDQKADPALIDRYLSNGLQVIW